MRSIGILMLLVVIGFFAYEFFHIAGMWGQYVALMRVASDYQNQSQIGGPSILVLGDDFAEGVGASSPTDSLPALLGAYFGASVENYAAPDAGISDLAAQLQQAKQRRYDIIVIEAGAADVMELHSLDDEGQTFDAFLQQAEGYSSHILVLSPPAIGQSPIFPSLVGDFFVSRAYALRSALQIAAEEENNGGGILFVDLTADNATFESDPSLYWSADGYHPSDAGYALWATTAENAMRQNWPTLQQ